MSNMTNLGELEVDQEVGLVLENRLFSRARIAAGVENGAQILPIKLETLRDLRRPDLINSLIENFKAGWLPNTLEIQALLCILVRNDTQVGFQGFDEEAKTESRFEGEHLPWPPECISKNRFVYGSTTEEEIAAKLIDGDFLGQDSARLGKRRLIDAFGAEEIDPLFLVMKKLLEKIDQQTATNIAVFILKHLDQFFKHSLQDETIEKLINLMFRGLDIYAAQSLRVGHRMVEFAHRHFSDRFITPPGYVRFDDSDEYGYYLELFFGGRKIPFYRALATQKYDAKLSDKLLGLALRKSTLPSQLNLLRTCLLRVPEIERKGMEALLRSILGLVSGLPVWTNLEDLYASIKFEEYPLSAAIEEERVVEIDALLKKYGVNPEEKVLDLGCGTGWLVGGLRQKGYHQVTGFDASARNLQVAKEKYGDYFLQGDWKEIPPSLRGQKVIISKERTLPHVEDSRGFIDVITQVVMRLDEDGLFIFDMPDPTQGTYKESLQRYRETMKKFGYSDGELADFWYVVDSPDGLNFYNRFVPSRKKIISLLRDFDILEQIDEEMPDGNQNMLFVCRLKKKSSPQLDSDG